MYGALDRTERLHGMKLRSCDGADFHFRKNASVICFVLNRQVAQSGNKFRVPAIVSK